MAEQTIQDAITIDAPAEDVFRALTEPEALEHWLATEVESDGRTGGHFRYSFEFEDPAQNNVQEGEYSAVEDGRRVALPWTFGFSPKQTAVDFALRSEGERTRVDFTHSGFEQGEPWDAARERFTGGWRMFLEGLKRHVETGQSTLPFGMKSRR